MLNANIEKNLGIVTYQVEHGADDSDTSLFGTCELSCTSHNLDEYDSLYCSADYRTPDDKF